MTDPSQPVVKIVKTGHKFAPKRFWDVIAPAYFVIFQAQVGSVLALGDKMFILAVFPETIIGAPMSQPDPGSLGNWLRRSSVRWRIATGCVSRTRQICTPQLVSIISHGYSPWTLPRE